MRRALIERIAQQRAGARHFAAVESLEAFVDQGFGDALLLGLRAARAIDVGARPIVVAIEEQHARPEVDGRFELAREIVIEARDEEILDARLRLRRQGAPRQRRGPDVCGSAMGKCGEL